MAQAIARDLPCGQILQNSSGSERAELLLQIGVGRINTYLHSSSKGDLPTTHEQKGLWRSKREGASPHSKCTTYSQTLLLESILAKRCAHTHGRPEIYQRQTLNLAKQDDWLKGNAKKCPAKHSNHTKSGLSPLLCLSTHILFSSSHNKHFVSLVSVSYVEIHFYTADKPGAPTLATGYWYSLKWPGFGALPCSDLTSILSVVPKSCFKLLQVRPPKINGRCNLDRMLKADLLWVVSFYTKAKT